MLARQRGKLMAGCDSCDYGKETFKADVVGTVVYCKKKKKGVMPELSRNCHMHSDKGRPRRVARRVFPDENLACDNPLDEVKRLEHLLRKASRDKVKLLDMISKMRGAGAVVVKAADRALETE